MCAFKLRNICTGILLKGMATKNIRISSCSFFVNVND